MAVIAGKGVAASFRTIGIAAILIPSTLFLDAAEQNTALVPPAVCGDSKSELTDAQVLKQVNDKLQLWQKRMNLVDWSIQARLVRRNALVPKTLGGIHWDRDTMTATLDVLSTSDYNLPTREMLDDMEFTVVHELVHLSLSSLPRSEASRSLEERVVNEIAGALLRLSKD